MDRKRTTSVDFSRQLDVTLATEASVVVHETVLLADLEVDGLVSREIVETQVLRQPRQLLVGQRFLQKVAHSFDSAAQILFFLFIKKSLTFLFNSIGTWKVANPFQVFVEEEEQIGMVAQVPGLQEGREKRREID